MNLTYQHYVGLSIRVNLTIITFGLFAQPRKKGLAIRSSIQPKASSYRTCKFTSHAIIHTIMLVLVSLFNYVDRTKRSWWRNGIWLLIGACTTYFTCHDGFVCISLIYELISWFPIIADAELRVRMMRRWRWMECFDDLGWSQRTDDIVYSLYKHLASEQPIWLGDEIRSANSNQRARSKAELTLQFAYLPHW